MYGHAYAMLNPAWGTAGHWLGRPLGDKVRCAVFTGDCERAKVEEQIEASKQRQRLHDVFVDALASVPR